MRRFKRYKKFLEYLSAKPRKGTNVVKINICLNLKFQSRFLVESEQADFVDKNSGSKYSFISLRIYILSPPLRWWDQVLQFSIFLKLIRRRKIDEKIWFEKKDYFQHIQCGIWNRINNKLPEMTWLWRCQDFLGNSKI